MPDIVRITPRSRNLGFGSRNDTEEAQDKDGNLHLRVKSVNFPSVRGGPRVVKDAYELACRVNQGLQWNFGVFVGDRKIVRLLDGPLGMSGTPVNMDMLLRSLRADKELWVELE